MWRRRPDIVLVLGLLGAQLAFLFTAPVLVGHDLPQHLAYTRLLADADSSALPPVYDPPLAPDAYFTTYRVLGAALPALSLDLCCRLLYAAYAIALTLSFFALARAVDETPNGKPQMTAALGPLLVWNPVTCMGFLPFMLAIPFALGAIAAALRVGRRPSARGFAVFVALVAGATAFHTAAAAMGAFVVVLVALARRTRADLALAFGFLLTGLMTRGLCGVGTRAAHPTLDDWWTNVRVWGLYDGTVGTFLLSFAPPEMKAKLALATVLGPFPDRAKLLAAAALFIALVVVVRYRRPSSGRRSRRVFAIASALFVVATLYVPTAIQVPDDMCLIDLRMFVFAFAFLVALLPRQLFARTPARAALWGVSLTMTALWGWAILGAGAEAKAALDLTDRLSPNDRLLALSFHDRSAYFDDDNAMLHNVGVHFTGRTRGTTTLFWGRFNRHLPIGYREGAEPPHPPPWAPEQWTEEHLRAATHVLVSRPDSGDGDLRVRAAERLDEEGGLLERVACEGAFCLYEVKRETAM